MDVTSCLNYISQTIGAINTMFVGIVTGIDGLTNRYDIQPILKADDGSGDYLSRAIIVKCPASFIKTKTFYVRACYEIGDVVYVGCSKESMDFSLLNNKVKSSGLDGVALFREVDGVVLGGLMTEEDEVLDPDTISDFIIQNRQNKDSVIIHANGGISLTTGTSVDITSPIVNISQDMNINGNVKINGNTDITGELTAGGIVMNTHTHISAKPGEPTSPPQK